MICSLKECLQTLWRLIFGPGLKELLPRVVDGLSDFVGILCLSNRQCLDIHVLDGLQVCFFVRARQTNLLSLNGLSTLVVFFNESLQHVEEQSLIFDWKLNGALGDFCHKSFHFLNPTRHRLVFDQSVSVSQLLAKVQEGLLILRWCDGELIVPDEGSCTPGIPRLHLRSIQVFDSPVEHHVESVLRV